MPYTARTLISKAYYLSSIVSRELQSVSGQQEIDGLDLLNELLAEKAVNPKQIPYYSSYSWNAVIGQEMYFIPNLIETETFTFNIDTVRYCSRPAGRKNYFGTSRADNVTSLPFKWHVERCKGGSNIYLYFLPSQAFPLKIWGKFGLTDVTLDTDLALTYDEFYRKYLKYDLAEKICQDYAIPLPPQTDKELRKMESIIMSASPKDLTMDKVSTLQVVTALNYGDVNIGRGWRP